jgi:hypothetical protein
VIGVSAPHGYEDHGRYLAQADIIHELGHVVTLLATEIATLGPYPTFGSHALFINAQSNNNAAKVAIQWTSDGTAPNIFASDQAIVGPGGFFFIAFPVRAAFAIVQVVAPTALGVSVTLNIANSSAPGIPQAHPGDNILIQRVGVNIGGGANDTVESTVTWPGWAHWHVSAGGTPWQANLEVTDENGVWSIITLKTQGFSPEDINLLLPAMRVRQRLFNVSGGPFTMSGILVAHLLGADF